MKRDRLSRERRNKSTRERDVVRGAGAGLRPARFSAVFSQQFAQGLHDGRVQKRHSAARASDGTSPSGGTSP